MSRLSNVLASIDGGDATTDGYRGRGIYRQVIRNLQAVRGKIGGSITARVTWGNPDTTFEELDQLVDEDSPFDYLYWQFVADELYGGDSMARRKAVLVQLIDRFFSRSDVLYPVIPLMGMVRNKLFPTPRPGAVRRPHPVPRLHASAQCHAQRRDLSLPGHAVPAGNEDGRRQGQLAAMPAPCRPRPRCPATAARRSPGAAATA